ncbi:MAG: hypothetical protein GX777_07510 [Fastidiosipila sp.]|nr:hypothetical protein [Fastidiosipila sp.]
MGKVESNGTVRDAKGNRIGKADGSSRHQVGAVYFSFILNDFYFMAVFKMKKTTTFPAALLSLIMVFAVLTGCDQSSANTEVSKPAVVKKTTDTQQVSAGEAWLQSIFSQCKSGHGYCLPDSDKIFTKRYMAFYQEQLQIFEYPDFTTEDELLAAKKAYKNKWENIYPLGQDVWTPFGQGNGMMAGDTLENVSITRLSDLQYKVLVEYRDGEVSSNDLLLIPSGGAFLIDFIETSFKEQQAMQVKFSDPGIDKMLPLFMKNKANTTLYDDASIESGIVATVPDQEHFLLICLTAVKDKKNRTWYKCYYPKEQVQGWTTQVSHWGFNDDERHLPLLQNLTLANLQLGANPLDAQRLLGQPKYQSSETGPLQTSGYIDDDYSVTTTTMIYDGIELVYQDYMLIHAEINKPGKSFGWITIGDKKWNKDSIMKKFKLTDEDFYDNNQGVKVLTVSRDILFLSIFLDADDLVKTITWHYGS